MKDLFISYGRRESLGLVGRLHRELMLRGYMVWFDKVNIPDGERYDQRINQGIEAAHNFVYIMAPRCLTSPYCLLELEYARLLGKRVIPVQQMMIWNTTPTDLSEDVQELLIGFYNRHGIEVPKISTTQDVLIRSHQLLGTSDWLDAKTELGDKDCKDQLQWAQQYENNWSRHAELDYLRKHELPVFGEQKDSTESILDRLEIVLQRHRSYVEQHTRYLTLALLWQQQDKQHEYLLADKEQLHAEQWQVLSFEDGAQPPCVVTALIEEYILFPFPL